MPEELKGKQPKCMYCNVEPFRFVDNVVQTVNGNIVALVWCADCMSVYSTQVIGRAQQIQLPDLTRKDGGKLIRM